MVRDFFRGWMSFLSSTNSVKALKGGEINHKQSTASCSAFSGAANVHPFHSNCWLEHQHRAFGSEVSARVGDVCHCITSENQVWSSQAYGAIHKWRHAGWGGGSDSCDDVWRSGREGVGALCDVTRRAVTAGLVFTFIRRTIVAGTSSAVGGGATFRPPRNDEYPQKRVRRRLQIFRLTYLLT